MTCQLKPFRTFTRVARVLETSWYIILFISFFIIYFIGHELSVALARGGNQGRESSVASRGTRIERDLWRLLRERLEATAVGEAEEGQNTCTQTRPLVVRHMYRITFRHFEQIDNPEPVESGNHKSRKAGLNGWQNSRWAPSIPPRPLLQALHEEAHLRRVKRTASALRPPAAQRASDGAEGETARVGCPAGWVESRWNHGDAVIVRPKKQKQNKKIVISVPSCTARVTRPQHICNRKCITPV